MKHIKNFNKLNESYSAYTDVWVVIKKGDTDINEIYLDKSEAEKAKNQQQSEFDSHMFRHLPNLKYIVVSLDDAISIIKDEIKDDNSWNNEDY